LRAALPPPVTFFVFLDRSSRVRPRAKCLQQIRGSPFFSPSVFVVFSRLLTEFLFSPCFLIVAIPSMIFPPTWCGVGSPFSLPWLNPFSLKQFFAPFPQFLQGTYFRKIGPTSSEYAGFFTLPSPPTQPYPARCDSPSFGAIPAPPTWTRMSPIEPRFSLFPLVFLFSPLPPRDISE